MKFTAILRLVLLAACGMMLASHAAAKEAGGNDAKEAAENDARTGRGADQSRWQSGQTGGRQRNRGADRLVAELERRLSPRHCRPQAVGDPGHGKVVCRLPEARGRGGKGGRPGGIGPLDARLAGPRRPAGRRRRIGRCRRPGTADSVRPAASTWPDATVTLRRTTWWIG